MKRVLLKKLFSYHNMEILKKMLTLAIELCRLHPNSFDYVVCVNQYIARTDYIGIEIL